jgi:hypothetical protein
MDPQCLHHFIVVLSVSGVKTHDRWDVIKIKVKTSFAEDPSLRLWGKVVRRQSCDIDDTGRAEMVRQTDM